DHEIMVFSIFGDISRNINKTVTFDFRRANFGLFRRLLQRVPWEAALENKGVQERTTVILGWWMVSGSRIVPVIQEEAVREVLSCLDIHKSLRPDGIHPRVMRKLTDELVKLLSIISQQSWLTREVPGDWKLANMAIHKTCP
ncbi:hypothetical protein HGM15179_020238, partial [Zosterops borbonicus]